jgi:hypothetical protein
MKYGVLNYRHRLVSYYPNIIFLFVCKLIVSETVSEL